MNVILLNQEQIHQHTAIIHDPNTIKHIKTVLGAGVGDVLKVGQIGGLLGTAIIRQIDDVVVLDDVHLTKKSPDKLDLTVVLALPRPKVLRRLVMDMTAMGVSQMVLMNSYRTDKSYWGSPLLARLDEFVLEGLQQGVDTIPPKIILAKRFKPFVEDELSAMIGDGRAMVAHPYTQTRLADYLADGLPKVMIVGAEGGFIPYEIKLLQSVGVQAVSFGDRILRTEAAVNALLGRWLG